MRNPVVSPGRDTPLGTIENSPASLLSNSHVFGKSADLRQPVTLSASSAVCPRFIFLFHFRVRVSRRRCVVRLHAGKLLVIAVHNIRNFSSDEATIYTEKSRELMSDVCDSREQRWPTYIRKFETFIIEIPDDPVAGRRRSDSHPQVVTSVFERYTCEKISCYIPILLSFVSESLSNYRLGKIRRKERVYIGEPIIIGV